jgi:hypothetical protein
VVEESKKDSINANISTKIVNCTAKIAAVFFSHLNQAA